MVDLTEAGTSLVGAHVLSSDQFDRDQLEMLFELADLLQPVAQGQQLCRVLEGAIMASLFFEPSTRTRLSCDAAFMRLGGAVSHTTGEAVTSIVKGESLADTSRVVSGYCDLIVMRHPNESAVYEFAAATHVPVINGGNGAGEHPTQALLDLYTLSREFARVGKTVDGATVALVGDLRHGRTVHSLLRLLSRYDKLRIVCASPPALALPDELTELVARAGHDLELTSSAEEALRSADAIYATRLQVERVPDGLAAYGSDFRIDQALIDRVSPADAVIMHPLPRNSRSGANDLSTDLNQDPRLAIFRQTDSGVPTRMALFATVLGVVGDLRAALRPAAWYRPRRIGPDDAAFYSSPDARP